MVNREQSLIVTEISDIIITIYISRALAAVGMAHLCVRWAPFLCNSQLIICEPAGSLL